MAETDRCVERDFTLPCWFILVKIMHMIKVLAIYTYIKIGVECLFVIYK